MDPIIKLNVGGQVFMTSESTLTWPGPECFFSSLILGRMSSCKDSEGALFIDRDPHLFSIVLTYLRTRDIRVDPRSDINALRQEAIYYGIDPLVTKIDLCWGRTTCGGLLFLATLAPPISPIATGIGMLSLTTVFIMFQDQRRSSPWQGITI